MRRGGPSSEGADSHICAFLFLRKFSHFYGDIQQYLIKALKSMSHMNLEKNFDLIAYKCIYVYVYMHNTYVIYI